MEKMGDIPKTQPWKRNWPPKELGQGPKYQFKAGELLLLSDQGSGSPVPARSSKVGAEPEASAEGEKGKDGAQAQ